MIKYRSGTEDYLHFLCEANFAEHLERGGIWLQLMLLKIYLIKFYYCEYIYNHFLVFYSSIKRFWNRQHTPC